ncbi:hypothetical protein [Bradyrhizobium elkanii]
MHQMRAGMHDRREIDGVRSLAFEAGKGLRQTDEAGGERGPPRHRRRCNRKFAETRLSVPQRDRGCSEPLLQPREIIPAPAGCEQLRRKLIVEREIGTAARCATAARAQAGGNPRRKLLAAGMRQKLPQPADREARRLRPGGCELIERGENRGEFSCTRKARQHPGQFGQQRMGGAASGAAADVPDRAADRDQIIGRSLRRPLLR